MEKKQCVTITLLPISAEQQWKLKKMLFRKQYYKIIIM